ncbi:MAG TPA: thioredoxin domain-containing protein [Acidobacteriota bacterium]|nr:thioredoxin domain-containing protein [Acidobacteriota bacterium]
MRYFRFSSLFVILSAALGLSPQAPGQERSPAGPRTVASVDGTAISEEELNKAAAADLEKLDVQKLQFEANFIRNRQQILENTLKRLVEERLLDAEAARQGTNRKDLLAKEVDQKLKDPTPEEVSAFYESNKDRIRAPKEQVAVQIQQYLKQQNYTKIREELIESLKKGKDVTIFLEPLRADVAVAGEPVRGPEKAPVTIIEFSDFQCPYCRSFSTTLERVMKEFGSEVRLVYRQFPLNEIHPMAEKAAEASLCAQDQGKFWEMHDTMFKDQANLKVEDLKIKASGLGLDASAFNACLDSGKYAQRIQKDARDGAAAGASGTPSFFVNGRFFNGAIPYEQMATIIKEELQKKGPVTIKP